MVMHFLKPPKSKYTHSYEQEVFKVSWNVYLLLSAVFLFLTILHLSSGDPNGISALMAFCIGAFGIIILKVHKKYLIPAIIATIFGTLINQYNIYFIENAQRVISVMWMVTISLYAFQTLGTIWGVLCLSVNLLGLLMSYVYLPVDGMIEALKTLDSDDIIDITLNLVFQVFTISYFLHLMLRTARTSVQSYEESNQKLQEQYDIVKQQNEEKNVMIKEIHHRVKNNLQIITSLLRLQSADIKDARSLEYFREASQRVLAMALIHEKMYQTQDLAKIDLESYLNSLIDELIASYSVESEISINLECEIEHVLPKSVVPFALLFNELVSNSIKHAFEKMEDGTIDIKITKVANDHVKMEYCDNGIWKDPIKSNSFGLELIDSLTEQLDGTWERKTENGTTYIFNFQYLK